MNPDQIMEGVLKEIESTLKQMAKAKKAEDKLIYSKTLKNLCISFKEIISAVTSTLPSLLEDDFFEDFDDFDDDYDDDDRTIPF